MLGRVPWWGWLAIMLVTLYGIYNPSGASIYHMWVDNWDWWLSVKLLVTLLPLVILGIVCDATWRSIGLLGVGVVVAILGGLLWVASDLGFARALSESAGWITQPLAAIVLTIGLRWARVWRVVTGRTQVDDTGSEVDAHTH